MAIGWYAQAWSPIPPATTTKTKAAMTAIRMR